MTEASYFRLDLGYDGSRFSGWQSQEGQRTVQGVMEGVLSRMMESRVSLTVAGRTDTGVHARSQTAAFTAATRMTPLQVQRALHSELPGEIFVHNCGYAEEEFHPRHSAKARIYEYILDPRPRAEPWREPYVWACPKKIDPDKMQRMAAMIIGEKDFSSFCSAQDPSPSKMRRIFQSSWRNQKGDWVYRVTGNAFLWRMVRRLVGAMVRLSCVPDGVPEFAELLNTPRKKHTPPPAPPTGLYLHKVVYHEFDFPY